MSVVQSGLGGLRSDKSPGSSSGFSDSSFSEVYRSVCVCFCACVCVYVRESVSVCERECVCM